MEEKFSARLTIGQGVWEKGLPWMRVCEDGATLMRGYLFQLWCWARMVV